MHFFQGHKQIKSEESKNQKNSEAKKTSNYVDANGSNESKLSGQSDYTISAPSWLGKKKFRLYCGVSQGKNFNTPAINENTTAIKKNKKFEIDLSHIKYYFYYKKEYYSNKCLDKKPKNKCWCR